ncbi:MAG: phospholipase D family protein, partial [Bdellovibrio sp.]|nr:phospholipase D family protein [Bdellovibrio sp.]
MVRLLTLTFVAVFSLANCQSLPTNVSRPTSWAIPDQSQSRLYEKLEPRKKDHPPEFSGHYPLILGDDAFVARVTLARMADHSLDIQYYIWNSDLTGYIMMDEILEAADRGVRVRILLDDLNLGPYEKTLRILSLHPNVYIRLSNPFANRYFRILDLTRLSDIDRRMHNKVFIADNEAAIMGGRNIGNEYFWASKEFN